MNTFLIILGLAVIAGAVYFYFYKNSKKLF